MVQNASSNSSTPIKLSVAWPCLWFYRWNEPMSGMNPKTWISSKQNSGSCPNRNLIQLRHTCLSETQPPLSSAFDSIPWGSKILRYWSLIGGGVRVVQPIVIEIPCYPWNYMKLSMNYPWTIHELSMNYPWNCMKLCHQQLGSIPPKICFRNPVVAPIFSFNTIPRMLPLLQNVVKSYVSETCFTSPPITSLHSFLPTERRLKGGNSVEAKTSMSKRPKVWPERLWEYTYIICIYIYKYIYIYQNM